MAISIPEEALSPEEVERNLVFVGLIGMIDPPREEVKPALKKAMHAGIRTVMITGDYPNTARAIAQKIGLIRENHKVLTGADLDTMDDETLFREIETVDVRRVVESVVGLTGHTGEREGTTIEIRVPEGLPAIKGDAEQLQQVILNLLRNALDALEDRPDADRHLLIETGFGSQGMAFIRVKDNGSGIAAEDLKHLFDPFFSTKKTGMGMGLSISQTIVAEHNGRIMADSLKGKGTVFTIELPASSVIAESIAS